MTITLPWPDPALSPNARGHHMKRARHVKAARRDGFYAAREAKASVAAGDVPVVLNITFHPPTRARHDVDNLQARLKSHLDGIADAIGVNDHLFRPTSRIGEPVKGGRVEVVIL